jgi:glycosyltransferase involved in cell wall biosynthesis
MKAIQPDLVISNTIVPVTPSIAALLSGIDHVWYIHEQGKEDHGYSFMFGEYITKRIIGLVSRLVLVNSLFVFSRYKNFIKARKLKTIYQPVVIPNNRIRRLNKTNDLVILMVGRFAPGKGQIEAIEALKGLIKNGEEINLVMVGAANGEYDKNVRNYIKKYDLSSRIRIVDFTPNPEVYYEMADIALICSKYEAFGRITIEAMKYGLPIIASKAGANTELINDGVTGIYYESGNIEDLMNKILKLKDIELRDKIGKNALKWANEKFNLEQYAKDLQDSILTIHQ